MHDNKTIIPPHDRGEELRMIAVEDHVLGILYGRHQERKERVAKGFTPGEKHDIKNEQGLKLGSASMSAPNKKAVCKDDAVLAAMAHERGMELVDDLPHPGTEAAAHAVEVLLEHAPELLVTTVTDVDAKALADEVLERWQITGVTPMGWEIVDASKPTFRVAKARTAPAKAAMAHLAGQVDHILSIEAPTTEKQENQS